MSDITAGASQQKAVAATLANAGVTEFPKVELSQSASTYAPAISIALRSVIEREAAASPANVAATANALAVLGIDHAAAVAEIGPYLKQAGVSADVSRLSASTIAAVKAIVDQQTRLAGYKAGSK